MRVSSTGLLLAALAVAAASGPAATVPFVAASTSTGDRAIYEPLRPARVFDTRRAADGPAVTGPATRTVQVTGKGGVPEDATAATLTITAVAPTKSGYVIAYPGGETRPTAFTLNYAATRTASTGTTLRLGTGGAVALYVSAGTAHVVVEVTGYFRGHDHDDRYLTKAAAQARTAPGAFTCTAGTVLQSAAADGTPTCVAQDAAEPPSPWLGVPSGSLLVLENVVFTLQGDTYYSTVDMGPSSQIKTNGFRLFVRDTITMGANASITRNGTAGTTAAPGAALAPGTLGGSGAGACGVASGVTNSLGSAGGAAGPGNFGGQVTRPANAVGGAGILRALPNALIGRTLDGELVMGGAGGGGQACGGSVGGGGGGGGVMVLAVGRIIAAGGNVISADGGSSAAAGGGGGGVVVLASQHPLPAGLTVRAAGGAAGPGMTAGSAGAVFLHSL